MRISMRFHLMLSFVRSNNDIDPYSCSWELGDFLSGINLWISPENRDIVTHTGDPAYWYDWKALIEEELAKDKTILDEENGLTLEQGLVAIQYFLNQRYWIKNNDMLLKDVHEDLVAEYQANQDSLESSQLWQEWLAAVAEGEKYEKVFQDES